MTKWTSYRADSRINWGSDREGRSLEQINCGALLRIADATEKMAQRHTDLIRARDYYERRYYEIDAECNKLHRSNTALRAYIKRLKAAK